MPGTTASRPENMGRGAAYPVESAAWTSRPRRSSSLSRLRTSFTAPASVDSSRTESNMRPARNRE